MAYDPVLNREIYNSVSSRYDRLYHSGAKGLYLKRLESDLMCSMLEPEGKKVLDVGTGTGRLAMLLKDRAAQVIGIDASEKMIEAAIEKNTGHGDKVKFYCMDACDMKFPDNYFDIVTLAGAFEFVQDMSCILQQVRRVLVTKGQFVFTCFNKDPLFGVLPKRAMIESHSLESIGKALSENGFRMKSSRSSFFIPLQAVWKVNSLLTFGWLQEAWFRAVLTIEEIFLHVSFLSDKGIELIILCEKV